MIWITALALIAIGAGLPCDAACQARAVEPMPIWPLFVMAPIATLVRYPWLGFVLWAAMKASIKREDHGM